MYAIFVHLGEYMCVWRRGKLQIGVLVYLQSEVKSTCIIYLLYVKSIYLEAVLYSIYVESTALFKLRSHL
jgi:hypothetical protein